MVETDPRQNRERAWEIAINPASFSKTEKKLLFERGLSHYQTDNGLDEKTLLKDVSNFIADALDERPRGEVTDDPLVDLDQPGKLVVQMSLATTLLLRHPDIVRDARDPKIHKFVRDYYLNHLYAATIQSSDCDIIRLTLGEVVYGRDQEDDYGPPVGRPVEAITSLSGFDEMFFKVPLVHANRKCEARENNDPDGQLEVVIDGPYIYIPVSDFETKYEQYYYGHSGLASQLEAVVEVNVTDNTLKNYQKALKGINDRVSEMIEIGKANKVFYEHQYPPRLKAILMAVEAADPDVATLGEELTTETILDVIEVYHDKTDIEWVQNILSDLGSPHSVGKQLTEYADDESIEHVTVDRSGETNTYTLEYTLGNHKLVEVKEIEDLLELPCMSNIHEMAMQDAAPRRWYLYSFVRIILELDTGFTVDDIKSWFSQYPWYDGGTTEYQVKYEKNQRVKGERPMPVGCNNDNRNFERVCIGRENCDYSIYQSLNFNQDVYDRLDDHSE
jgi:hypothetical protein